MVKPLDLDELTARMRSVMRRAHGRADSIIRHGHLCLGTAAHRVERKGAPVALSAHKYVVPEALLQRSGAVLSSAQLEKPPGLAFSRATW